MLPLLALAPAAISALSSLASFLIKKGQDDKAAQLLEDARKQYGDVGIPDISELKAQLSGLDVPKESALEGVKEDPRMAGYQESAVEQMGRYAQGGLQAEDRAALSEALTRVAQSNAQQRAALAQQAGGLSSGQALGLAQMAQGQSANASAQNALGIAGQANARALDALKSQYAMASQRSGQKWGMDRERAQAADEMRKANAAFGLNRARVQSDLLDDDYQRRLAKARGMISLAGGSAADMRQQGADLAGAVAGGGQALGSQLYQWMK